MTAAEVDGDVLVLHEDTGDLRVPLRSGWTAAEADHVSASATQDADGNLVVDLVFLDTPHRLVVTIDPAAATFVTTWASVPLTGIGVETHLGTMYAPPPSAP